MDPCPVSPVIDLIFGRWTTQVLWTLNHDGRQRFTDLRGRLPMITPKVLTQRLRQLERDGLVTRTYYAEMPPRVEYQPTELALTLVPVFGELLRWSDAHMKEVEAARAAYDGPEGRAARFSGQ